MTGFALASALGGLATTGEMLFAARALQVPSARCSPRRAGAAHRSLHRGHRAGQGLRRVRRDRRRWIGRRPAARRVLTEYANWRWCLLVNIPVAAIAIAFALPLVPESRAHGNTRYDVPGAVVVTAGLVSWSTASPRPPRTAGTPPRRSVSSPRAWCCSAPSW
ncbi:hypothetical protein NKG94_13560 [Micromonospora sp. M12]